MSGRPIDAVALCPLRGTDTGMRVLPADGDSSGQRPGPCNV
jgi:hypothetical protein